MILVANHKATEVLQPSKEPLNFPAAFVSPQRSAVLGRPFAAIGPMRSNHLHVTFGSQPPVQLVAVIGLVTHQTLRQFVQEASVQRSIDQGHFMWASAGRANGERKTFSVCKAHDFGPFAAFGLAHTIAPFFAGANVASMKPSLRSIPPRSFKSSARAERIFSNTPERVHAWKRRWQVLFGGYRSGKSAQGAPVRRIQRIPLRTSLGSCGGRPDLPDRTLGFGMKPAIHCHCSFVRSMNPISAQHYRQY